MDTFFFAHFERYSRSPKHKFVFLRHSTTIELYVEIVLNFARLTKIFNAAIRYFFSVKDPINCVWQSFLFPVSQTTKEIRSFDKISSEMW